jgi:hypothetical protein
MNSKKAGGQRAAYATLPTKLLCIPHEDSGFYREAYLTGNIHNFMIIVKNREGNEHSMVVLSEDVLDG